MQRMTEKNVDMREWMLGDCINMKVIFLLLLITLMNQPTKRYSTFDSGMISEKNNNRSDCGNKTMNFCIFLLTISTFDPELINSNRLKD